MKQTMQGKIPHTLHGRLPAISGLLLLGGAGFLTGCNAPSNTGSAPAPTGAPTVVANKTPVATPAGAPAGTPAALAPLPPGGVKGIYLTGWVAGLKHKFGNLVSLVDRTELNAMVIDVKDDGELSYDVDVPLAKEIHASRKMFNVDKVMAILHAHQIFPIARIACMRDSVLPKFHPEMAVHSPDGSVWHDKTHHAWLNPYSKAVWQYNVDIAVDALKHGFKEVQFDYVRFPSEGKLNTLVYNGKPKGALREDQISAFMKYAKERIKAQGGWFSADVFGLTSLVKNDEGIGQKFQKVVQNVDYLCPMVYPSHYAYGEYNLPDPNKQPYKIITLSVGDAIKRLKSANTTCKLRPWIQDFTLRGVHYGPEEVKAEIKALHDLGINEWLLWNAGNRFTEAALAKDTPPPLLSDATTSPTTPGVVADAKSK